jgi:hypothetical protein
LPAAPANTSTDASIGGKVVAAGFLDTSTCEANALNPGTATINMLGALVDPTGQRDKEEAEIERQHTNKDH